MTRRIVTFVVDDTEAAEALSSLFVYATAPPWKPLTEEDRNLRRPQERFNQAETDGLLLAFLKRSAPHIELLSIAILPPDETAQ